MSKQVISKDVEPK